MPKQTMEQAIASTIPGNPVREAIEKQHTRPETAIGGGTVLVASDGTRINADVVGELLALAKLFAETIRYEQRRNANAGDDEGVSLKGFTLARVEAAIAVAEGREIAHTPKAEPALADFEQRRDGWLIAFVPISSAARQWSIDASPKGARWEHERWYAQKNRAPAVRHAIESEGFTVREG